ncbi:MAG: alpha/beta hydrolase, partial [Tateyamaria sp.]|nr:alpha/beta hydrolase [Tateyamaria sp.]
MNQDCWQWTSPTLAQKYRVLTYDLYGHGLTISPPSNPSLSLFSKQLVEMLDYCNIQTATILGFSLGGMIARRFAQDFPKKTDALIILHSPHRRTLEAQRAILKRVAQA